MKNAKLTVVSFNDSDVIATSGAISISVTGTFNGTAGDARLWYKGVEYDSNSLDALNAALAGTGVPTITGDTVLVTQYFASDPTRFSGQQVKVIFGTGDSTASKPAMDNLVNVTYTWNGIHFASVPLN